MQKVLLDSTDLKAKWTQEFMTHLKSAIRDEYINREVKQTGEDKLVPVVSKQV